MYIALFDSVTIWSLTSELKICQWRLDWLFSLTRFFSDDLFYQTRSVMTLALSGITLFAFAQYMTLMLNIMLSIDLFLMIRYPFSKKDSRMTLYLIISFIMSVISAYFGLNGDAGNEIQLKITMWMIDLTFLVYFLCFLSTTIYAWIKLSGPGMSKEVRMLVIKRHVLTGILYSLCNVYSFWGGNMLIHPEAFAKMNSPDANGCVKFFKVFYFG